MSASAKAQQEPSMEDILASIRKIISDDDQAPAAVPPEGDDDSAPSSQDDIDALLAAFDSQNDSIGTPTEPTKTEETQEEILELTDAIEDEDSSSAQEDPFSFDDIEFREVMEEEEHDPATDPLESFAAENPTPDTNASLFSQAFSAPAPEAQNTTGMNAEQIISSRTGHAVQNAFQSLAHTILTQNARTLEDLVAEMLRPMLKSWIDDNLPAIVERTIKAEIERVARGGRM